MKRTDHRRLVSLVLTGCLALGANAGLAQGMTSCATPARSDSSRPLSAAEAQRLAGMRQQTTATATPGCRRSSAGPAGNRA